MSGHSKFANIKHRKGKNDLQKAKIYTRIGKELQVAVKNGGSDPTSNARLRDVMGKARANNMPNDNVMRVIKKASGDSDSINYETIVYEGYGVNGVAVVVEALTDNRNRAAANIRNAFTKGDGNMGQSGCVSYMFTEKGQIIIEKSEKINKDDLEMLVINAGASDFVENDEYYEISTEPYDLTVVQVAIEDAKIEMMSSEVGRYPNDDTYIKLTNEQDIKKMNKLIALLDEDDDVQNYWHNCEQF